MFVNYTTALIKKNFIFHKQLLSTAKHAAVSIKTKTLEDTETPHVKLGPFVDQSC